ncbi:hypothetical protein P0Y35_16400 [Kiritimatiellaeota bacterium B1221]|nr:hypothetical protein [Kiritimatiellaeota bacterium B1221]
MLKPLILVPFRAMDSYGRITPKHIEEGKLVNRVTSKSYLETLQIDALWNLGFISATNGNYKEAKSYFNQTLELDKLLNRAKKSNYYNAYDRIMMSEKNGAFVGYAKELEGLNKKIKFAMQWADYNFMLANFSLAQSLYAQMQDAAQQTRNENAYVRAVLGEMLIRNAQNDQNLTKEVPHYYKIAMQNPDAPATPYLLFTCSECTDGDPVSDKVMFNQINELYPNTVYAIEARTADIFRMHAKDHELRLQKIDKFIKDFPNETVYHKIIIKHDKTVTELYEKKRREYPEFYQDE